MFYSKIKFEIDPDILADALNQIKGYWSRFVNDATKVIDFKI